MRFSGDEEEDLVVLESAGIMLVDPVIHVNGPIPAQIRSEIPAHAPLILLPLIK